MAEPGDVDRALSHALRRLQARDRTRAQLAAALARKGYDAAVQDAVLERLSRVGYTEDGRVARARPAALVRRGRLAHAAVRDRMVNEGHPTAAAAAAVDEEAKGFDALAAARKVVAPHLGKGGPRDDRALARLA